MKTLVCSFWDRYAFSVGDVDFLWIDVALAAMARGQWPAFERRLAEGLACAARADLERAWPSQPALDEAATAFRYERDLISGADVNAWLERVGVSTDEWMAYLNRDLLRHTWRDDLDDILERFPPSARQLLTAAVPEGVCSGHFAAFERALCGRVAVVFDADAERFRMACKAQTPDSAVRLAHTHTHWLSMRPAADTISRLSTILHFQSSFDTLIEQVATNGRLNDVVDSNRLGWIQLVLDTVSFPTEAAAREAVLCVGEDGLTLHEVAALSRRPVDRRSVWLEEIDAEHRDRLLAADLGQPLGPFAIEGFGVTSLVSRLPPTLGDPRVAERARRALMDAALEHATQDHVTRRLRN